MNQYLSFRWIAALLISSFLFGMIVIGHGLWPGFERLTPLHLLFSAGLLLMMHRGSLRQLGIWIVACYLLGFTAEYIGVQGGWLFGQYYYSDVLGPRLGGTPLIIGVNWIVVSYAVCATVDQYLSLSTFIKIILSALLLILLDLLIEPVAIDLHFWVWPQTGQPPLQNYLGWLLVGLMQAALYQWLLRGSRNPAAPLVLLLELIFFAYLAWWL